MSHLPSEAVTMMRQEILQDPQFVLELAMMAGLPTAEDLQAEAEARAQMEQGQDQQIQQLQTQIQQLQAQLNNLPTATTTAKGLTIMAGDGQATDGRTVQATDSRLSNARTPTAHTHPYSQITGTPTLGGAASLSVGTTAGTVAAGNDSRFVDSRTPTGTAGGGLTGTYPSPTLASNAAIDVVIGNRTITDTSAPAGDTGTLTNLLSWLGNMVKAITGENSWRTVPAITLKAIATRLSQQNISYVAAGTIQTPAITLLSPVDVTIPFTAGTMPDTNYVPFLFVDGTAVGKLTAAYKSKTATSVTATLTPTALLTLGAGTVTVIAWKVAS